MGTVGRAVLVGGGVAAAAGIAYLIFRGQRIAAVEGLTDAVGSLSRATGRVTAQAGGGGVGGNVGAVIGGARSVVSGASGLVSDLNGFGQSIGLPSVGSLLGGLF